MAKRNPTCGCGPCSKPTHCHECCRCIPERICVILDPTESIGCSCGPREFALQWNGEGWSGILVCGDLTIDVAFTIEKEGADCFFFFESSCLGFTGENRRKMEFPPVPGFNCQEWSFVFEFDASDCGDEDCDIVVLTVWPIRVFPNPLSEMKGGCIGCRCLPEKLCIQIDLEDSTTESYGFIEWNRTEKHYTGEIPIRGEWGQVAGDPVRVTVNPVIVDGACAFDLTATGGIAFGGQALFPEEGDCPYELALFWLIEDDRYITARSGLCNTCHTIPCCPEPIPLTLYYRFTDISGCTTCSSPVSGTLVFNGSSWNDPNLASGCISIFSLQLDCGVLHLEFEYSVLCYQDPYDPESEYLTPQIVNAIHKVCPTTTDAIQILLSAGIPTDDCCQASNYFLFELQTEPFA